jgi:hypothetical protein
VPFDRHVVRRLLKHWQCAITQLNVYVVDLDEAVFAVVDPSLGLSALTITSNSGNTVRIDGVVVVVVATAVRLRPLMAMASME